MQQQQVTVKNSAGLHARPAALFVQKAMQFRSSVWVGKAGRKVNAKSILSILSLGVCTGDEIIIGTDGEDESAALHQLVSLVQALNE